MFLFLEVSYGEDAFLDVHDRRKIIRFSISPRESAFGMLF